MRIALIALLAVISGCGTAADTAQCDADLQQRVARLESEKQALTAALEETQSTVVEGLPQCDDGTRGDGATIHCGQRLDEGGGSHMAWASTSYCSRAESGFCP